MSTNHLNNSRVLLRFIVLLTVAAIAVGCRSGPPQTQDAQETSTVSSVDRPLTVFSQEITSSVDQLEVARGQKVGIPVTVKNTGSQTWWLWQGNYPVVLSYKWLKDSQMLPYEGERTVLPVPELKPGEATSFEANVLAPEKETGKLTLELTMVQEGVAWFSFTQGAKPLRINAVVK